MKWLSTGSAIATTAVRNISTSAELRPAAAICSVRLQIASYSNANATFANIVIRPARAAISREAEAPSGLRMAATTTLASRTHLTERRCHITGDIKWLMPMAA
jgi:hypothetical protein